MDAIAKVIESYVHEGGQGSGNFGHGGRKGMRGGSTPGGVGGAGFRPATSAKSITAHDEAGVVVKVRGKGVGAVFVKPGSLNWSENFLEGIDKGGNPSDYLAMEWSKGSFRVYPQASAKGYLQLENRVDTAGDYLRGLGLPGSTPVTLVGKATRGGADTRDHDLEGGMS